MEIKKSAKANLESYRGMFLFVGLFIALLAIFIFLNSSKANVKVDDLTANNTGYTEEEHVQVTRQDLTPPPPPPPQQQVSADVIQIVSNDVRIQDNFDFNSDVDDNTTVDFSDVDVTGDVQVEEEEPVVWAEQMPEFPGGIESLKKFLAENIKYPQLAAENDIQGTVYLRFVVTRTGDIGEVQVVRGVDPLLDEEAIRVVKGLPKFKPGQQGGRTVPVWYSVPIVFQLSN